MEECLDPKYLFSITYDGFCKLVNALAPPQHSSQFTSHDIRKIFQGQVAHHEYGKQKFHPREKFPHLYCQRGPDFAISYPWDLCLKTEVAYFFDEVKRRCIDEFKVDFDNATFFMDIFFIDQNCLDLEQPLAVSHGFYRICKFHFVFLAKSAFRRGWILYEVGVRLHRVMQEFNLKTIDMLQLLCSVADPEIQTKKFHSRSDFAEVTYNKIVCQYLPQIVNCDGVSNIEADLLEFFGRDSYNRMQTFEREDKFKIQRRLLLMYGKLEMFNLMIKQLAGATRIQLLMCSKNPMDVAQVTLYKHLFRKAGENEVIRYEPFSKELWKKKHNGSEIDSEEDRAELGNGAYAKTFRMSISLGERKVMVAGKRFSLRQLRKSKLSDSAIRGEAEILSSLDHQNVVKYLGVVTTGRHLFLVTELLLGSSLYQLIPTIKIAAAMKLLKQLASAIDYLHRRGIAHRDLKPTNLLLTKDKRNIKVADFGMAAMISESCGASMLTGAKGTPLYFAPEQARGHSYGRAVDMWACGLVAAELLAAMHLDLPMWDRTSPKVGGRLSEMVKQAMTRGGEHLGEEYGSWIEELIMALLEEDPMKRLRSKDFLEWINKEGQPYCTVFGRDRGESTAELLEGEKILPKNLREDSSDCSFVLDPEVPFDVPLSPGFVAKFEEEDTDASDGDDNLKSSHRDDGQKDTVVEKLRDEDQLSADIANDSLQSAIKPALLKPQSEGGSVTASATVQAPQVFKQVLETLVSADRDLEMDSTGRPEVFHELVQPRIFSSPNSDMEVVIKDKRIELWSKKTEYLAKLQLTGHTNMVHSVAFSPKGDLIATASMDQSVMLWDAILGNCIACLRKHRAEVNAVSWSPTGSLLASASDDKTVIVWDAAAAAPSRVLHGHEKIVTCVAWSPNSDMVVSGSDDGAVILWDLESCIDGLDQKESSTSCFAVTCFNPRRKLTTQLAGHAGACTAVAWNPRYNSRIVSASADTTLIIWDTTTATKVLQLRAHDSAVWAVCWSPAGDRLVSAADNGRLIVWERLGTIQRQWEGHANKIVAICWSQGDEIVSATWGREQTVKVWDASSGRSTHQFQGVRCCSCLHDRIVSATSSNTLTVWAKSPPRLLCPPLEGHRAIVRCAAWAPDSRRLATGSDDHSVRIWTAPEGTMIVELAGGHTCSVRALAWSPTGDRLASASDDGALMIWDPPSVAPVVQAQGVHAEVDRLLWGDGGKLLEVVAAGRSRTVWDAVTGQLATPAVVQ